MFIDPAMEELYQKELTILLEVAKLFGMTIGSLGNLPVHRPEIEYTLRGEGSSPPIKVLGSHRSVPDAELRQHFINQIHRALQE